MKIFGKKSRIIVAAVLVVLVFGIAWFGFFHDKVFGAYTKYVPDDATPSENSTLSEITVTSNGGTEKGAAGSKKEVASSEVPTAGYDDTDEDTKLEATAVTQKNGKGGERNPFVILEIVPDKAQQELTYLNPSGVNYPIDWLQLGIDTDACFIDLKVSDDAFYSKFYNSMGNWTTTYHYDLFEYGTDEDNPEYIEKGLSLIEPGIIYSYSFKKEDIVNAGYSYDAFESAYNNGNGSMADLQKQFPKLFPKATKDAAEGAKEGTYADDGIRDIAINNEKNWDKKKTSKGSKHYEVTLTSEDITIANPYYFSAKDVINSYSEKFTTDNDGNTIPEEVIKDTNNWTGKRSGSENYSYSLETAELEDNDFLAVYNKVHDMKWLAEKYPEVFAKDSNNKKIDASRINDSDTWVLSKSQKEKYEAFTSGYFYHVGAGEGDYALSNNTTWNSDMGTNIWVVKKSDTASENVWRYAEKEADIPEGYQEGKNWWSDKNSEGLYWAVGGAFCVEGTVAQPVTRMYYSFTYKNEVTTYDFTYDSGEQTVTYKFNYWGVKTNDILKRSLFVFKDEEECENFNVQVICMTPKELNEIAQKDDKDKLDLIERADLFYIAQFNSSTSSLQTCYNFYNQYILGNKSYSFDSSKEKVTSFKENDLEWDLCVKILKRLSENSNLPLMFTKPVGNLIEEGEEGDESIKMYAGYISDSNAAGGKRDYTPTEISTINNIGKLYLLSLQFDLQAGVTSSDDVYKRTLFGTDGIMNNVKKIALSDEVKAANGNTAQYTGYYVPDKVYSEKSSYLWNRYTFYPYDVEAGDDYTNVFKQYGYLKSYINTGAFLANNSTSAAHANHLDGTDGVSDDNNVTVVRGGNSANTNRSSLILLAEGEDTVNTMMEILYKIMHNGATPNANPLELSVLKLKKYYDRISDRQVLLDYNKDGTYADKTLYLKVSIKNPTDETKKNLEPGVVQSINLINSSESSLSSGELIPLDGVGGTALEKEDVGDIYGKDTKTTIHGYKVELDSELVLYIPFQLSDWQKGYDTVRVKLKGMTFDKKKNKCVVQDGTTTIDVAIDQRTLFNLQ